MKTLLIIVVAILALFIVPWPIVAVIALVVGVFMLLSKGD